MTTFTTKKLTLGLLSALVLAGSGSCQNKSACDDVMGSCLSLHVEGDGPFDTLRTTLHLIGNVDPQVQGDTTDSSGSIDLPATLRITPPPNVTSTEIYKIGEAGLRAGTVLATAESDSSFNWPDGSHIELTLRLASANDNSDGGTGDMTVPPTELKWQAEMQSGKQNLYSVWAGDANQTYTVGEQGTILSRQTDGTWKSESAATNSTLNSVAGIVGGSVFTVGAAPGAWRRDSSKWQTDNLGLNLGGNGKLLTVAVGETKGELWAGDNDGRVWHRTGSPDAGGTWQTPERAFPSGEEIFGVSSAGGAVFVVGDHGRVGVRKDSAPGTAWKTFQYPQLPTGDPFTLNCVWAFDKDNAIAVGAGGLLVRYVSAAWQPAAEAVIKDGIELFGVWGLSADRVWTIGADGLIVRVEGSRMTELARNTAQRLYGIHGRSESDIFIVGSAGGASLILHGTP